VGESDVCIVRSHPRTPRASSVCQTRDSSRILCVTRDAQKQPRCLREASCSRQSAARSAASSLLLIESVIVRESALSYKSCLFAENYSPEGGRGIILSCVVSNRQPSSCVAASREANCGRDHRIDRFCWQLKEKSSARHGLIRRRDSPIRAPSSSEGDSRVPKELPSRFIRNISLSLNRCLFGIDLSTDARERPGFGEKATERERDRGNGGKGRGDRGGNGGSNETRH